DSQGIGELAGAFGERHQLGEAVADQHAEAETDAQHREGPAGGAAGGFIGSEGAENGHGEKASSLQRTAYSQQELGEPVCDWGPESIEQAFSSEHHNITAVNTSSRLRLLL